MTPVRSKGLSILIVKWSKYSTFCSQIRWLLTLKLNAILRAMIVRRTELGKETLNHKKQKISAVVCCVIAQELKILQLNPIVSANSANNCFETALKTFNFVIKKDRSLILSNNYQSWCSENSTKCYFSFLRKHFLASSTWLVYERLLVLRACIATKLNLAVCTLQFYGKIIGHYLGTVENCTKRLSDRWNKRNNFNKTFGNHSIISLVSAHLIPEN